jgi:hypothetical protein
MDYLSKSVTAVDAGIQEHPAKALSLTYEDWAGAAGDGNEQGEGRKSNDLRRR